MRETGDRPQLAWCGDRRCALLLIHFAVAALSAVAIFRRGVRQRDRGRQAMPGPNGTLTLQSVRVLWHGIPLPTLELAVEFHSQVDSANDDKGEILTIVGALRLQPHTVWVKFIAHTSLRRPETIDSIEYMIQ